MSTQAPNTNPSEHGQHIGTDELDFIAKSYGLNRPIEIIPVLRGSPLTQKSILRTKSGNYLLKRRTVPQSEAAVQRFQLIHDLQEHLANEHYPAVPLIPAVDPPHPTMIHRDHHIYELARFVRGEPFNRSCESSREAGRQLAHLHTLFMSLPKTQYKQTEQIFSINGGQGSTTGRTYHAQPDLAKQAHRFIEQQAPQTDDPKSTRRRTSLLVEQYKHAAEKVNQCGFQRWPKHIIHGDWHPGNLIFQNDKVTAVLDFETITFAPRIIDIANGALHFSIIAGHDDPLHWPDRLDELRWYAFCSGYDEYRSDFMLSKSEIQAIPWLMIEALIYESLGPLASTGRFHTIPAHPFLLMLRRKVRWLTDNAGRLSRILAG